MKKIILLISFFILSISQLTAETIKYKVVSDTFYSDGDIECNIPIKKDTIITWSANKSVLPNINDDGMYENFVMDVEYNNETIYMFSTDLQVINTEKIVNDKKLMRIIPEYYLEVLNKKNPDLIFEKQPLWKSIKKRIDEADDPYFFEDLYKPESYYLSNVVILFSQHNYYLVENLKHNKGLIEIELIKYIGNTHYGETEDVFSDMYSRFRNDSRIKLLLQKDGDYFSLWINTKDNFVGRYFVASDLLYEQIQNLVKHKSYDLSKVTWPRHADGTCDYEEGKTLVAASSSATNVSINRTMSVKENLKLRSAEAASSNVLIVMAAGTKVKILELGKAEIIDSINSNWVRVEIISGKDRDGKDIKKKTTGWCYGGYLE